MIEGLQPLIGFGFGTDGRARRGRNVVVRWDERLPDEAAEKAPDEREDDEHPKLR